jgi:hypothetical protein
MIGQLTTTKLMISFERELTVTVDGRNDDFERGITVTVDEPTYTNS